MNASILQFQIEQLIIDHKKISINEIRKELKNLSTEFIDKISSIVSQLILKNCWRTEYANGRLFIIAESSVDKSAKTTTINHRDSETDTLLPKCIPANGDWVVTCVEGSSARLYFDMIYNRSEVRSAFSKIEKVKYNDCRASYYKKIIPLKEMQNY